MTWVVEAAEPLARGPQVLDWLTKDPVRNTAPATVLANRLDGTMPADGFWLAWLAGPGGDVAGAALRTPPRGILLPTLPSGAAAGLAEVTGPALPGASGPAEAVAEFVRAYADRHGATARPTIRQRLFRLDRLVRPPGSGELTVATDPALPVAWFDDFSRAVSQHVAADAAATTARWVARGRVLFWQVGGAPVNMVCHSPTVAGVTRIGPVWTPPEYRRHGYAAAATAALAARLARHGEVVLFADRFNRTATGVYERIGFRPVGDWDDWGLEY